LKIQFNQKQFAKTPLAGQIRDLIHFCVPKTPRYRQGLLVKVMFYTNKAYSTRWKGSYRCAEKHGLYKSERNMPNIESVITLKIGQELPSKTTLYLIAHECGHHITWVKDKRFGEKRADKIAKQIEDRYNKRLA